MAVRIRPLSTWTSISTDATIVTDDIVGHESELCGCFGLGDSSNSTNFVPPSEALRRLVAFMRRYECQPSAAVVGVLEKNPNVEKYGYLRPIEVSRSDRTNREMTVVKSSTMGGASPSRWAAFIPCDRRWPWTLIPIAEMPDNAVSEHCQVRIHGVTC